MKVIELVDLVQDFFANDIIGDQKGIYHPGVIIGHLRNVYNQSIYEAWEKGKHESDFSQLDAWTRRYSCGFQEQQGVTDYVFLPFTPAQLPDGMGIRKVCDHDDSLNVFAPIENGANVVFSELEVDTLDSVPTYQLEQSNLASGDGEPSHILRLAKLPTDGSINSVDVWMIVPLEQMGDYDDIALPMGEEETLVQKVIAVMTQKPKADTSNDMVASAGMQ